MIFECVGTWDKDKQGERAWGEHKEIEYNLFESQTPPFSSSQVSGHIAKENKC